MTKQRWRLAAVVIAVALATTEILLRLCFGFGHPLLYRVDSETGYVTVPNQVLRRFGARILINEFSMRSAPIAGPRPAGGERLLFVGDSVTFGTTYVDQALIFTELIKSGLQSRTGKSIEVLNASTGGWAPENEYRYLRSRGTFDANRVIFVLNTNDLAQPFTTLEVSPQFPVHEPTTAIGEVLERYLGPRLFALRISDPGSGTDDEPGPVAEAEVLKTLTLAQEFARQGGARFAVIFSPTDYYKLKTPAWQEAIAHLRRWAQDAGVEFLDMSPLYSHYGREQIYFDGIHLRPFGHRVIADAFLKELDGPEAGAKQ